MVKLHYPPVALLPQANREFVELAGAKCILAIDEEKQLFVVSDIFSEISWGQFWKNAAIADQIEKITIKHDDSDAIYDPEVLIDRILNAFKKIMDRKLLFFGIASFEGNAFETSVFDEIDLTREEADELMNLYKAKRVQNAFPNLKKGQYVEVNFFGKVADYFTLHDAKYLPDIAEKIQNYEGFASGIVAVAQGAANFIILTENITSTNPRDKYLQIQVDKNILNQFFILIKQKVLEAPISWFKIDLGIRGLESIDNWEDIMEDRRIVEMKLKYLQYVNEIITSHERRSVEAILADELGEPIDIAQMTPEEISQDIEEIWDCISSLNELITHNEAISLLYSPPKILFSSATKKGLAIGGAMVLLATDVGKNIICVGDLRQDVIWSNYTIDSDEDKKKSNISIQIKSGNNKQKQTNVEEKKNGKEKIKEKEKEKEKIKEKEKEKEKEREREINEQLVNPEHIKKNNSDKNNRLDFANLDIDLDMNNLEFFEINEPMQLQELYSKTFQKIMYNNQLFLGTLQLEANAFEFCLFPEIDIDDERLNELKLYYLNKSQSGKFPKLKDGYIQIKWFGDGNEYFTNYDCLGILDLADKMVENPIYSKGWAAGVVCVDEESTYFYILSNNFHKHPNTFDILTYSQLIKDLAEKAIAPLCWFKINLGLDSLKLHRFWRNAFQYTTLLHIIENYKKYQKDLAEIKKIEKKFQTYEK